MEPTHRASRAPNASRLTLKRVLVALGDWHSVENDPHLELVELRGGEVLFEQSTAAQNMYILVVGALGVRVQPENGRAMEISRLGPGAIGGEVALLGPLDAATLHQLQDELAWRYLSSGDVVFRQGDPADGMYIVVNGRLLIIGTTATRAEEVLGEVSAGEIVGEYALLTEAPRTATVYAVRETNVVRMPVDTFDRLVRAHPPLMRRVARITVERQQLTRAPGERAPVSGLSVALLPAGPGVDVFAFARALGETLYSHGSVETLDARRFEEMYGREGAALAEPGDLLNAAIVTWLEELEARHDFVLYAVETDGTAWTRRCIGHADRVLVIADPREDPAPGAAEQVLAGLEVAPQVQLVLWHPPPTDRPQGTAAWLDACLTFLEAQQLPRRV